LQLFKQLQRRNVFKVAAVYIVTAWLVMQVADIVLNNIAAPAWVFQVILLVLALGFPIAVILAWAFELTPEGLRRETASVAEGATKTGPRKKLDFLIFAVVIAALIYFVIKHDWQGKPEEIGPGEIRSIVVLPLDNLMNDPNQGYFVEGMHEALITELSKIKALRVISRTSAMRYMDSGKAVPEIASELGVDAVVEGSVLRAGNVVRVTAQLIEGRTDRHIWADNFDRELDDILAIYADVTREIVKNIRVNVTPDEQASLVVSRPVIPEVYELYLKGRYLCDNWSPQEMQQGVALLQKALSLDPQHAASHAKLSLCLQDSAFFEYLKPLDIDSQARLAAQTAVQLDDRLAEAHVALGGVNYYLGFDADSGEKEYLRALELNPNSIDTLLHLAWLYSQTGRFDEALGPAQRAVELDPLATATLITLGQVYHLNKDYDQAITAFEKALELDRSDPSVHYYLAWPVLQQGDYTRAVALSEYATELAGGAALYLSALGHAYGVSGMRQDALRILEELEQKPYTSPYNTALIHLGLGDHKQAIDWLEKAYDEHTIPLVYLKKGPRFDHLREDPRFIDLLARMGR
jgi:TolB-like protein/Tfp pilus assembly protein PilF